MIEKARFYCCAPAFVSALACTCLCYIAGYILFVSITNVSFSHLLACQVRRKNRTTVIAKSLSSSCKENNLCHYQKVLE